MTKTEHTIQLIEANPAASAIFAIAVKDYRHYLYTLRDEGNGAFHSDYYDGRYNAGIDAILAVMRGVGLSDIYLAVRLTAEEQNEAAKADAARTIEQMIKEA